MQYILYCFHNDTSLENNSQNGHSNESNKWIEDGHKSCQIKSSWLYVYLLYDKLSIYLFFDTFPWILPMLLILGFCCCSWFYLRLVYLKTATFSSIWWNFAPSFIIFTKPAFWFVKLIFFDNLFSGFGLRGKHLVWVP